MWLGYLFEYFLEFHSMKKPKQSLKSFILPLLILDIIVLAICFYLPINEYLYQNTLPIFQKLITIGLFIGYIGFWYFLFWLSLYLIFGFICYKFPKTYLAIIILILSLLLKLFYIIISLTYLRFIVF